MPIEIQCQQCQARFRVGDQYAGKRVKCAKCRATIVVEAAEPLDVEPVEIAPTVPAVQKPAAKEPAPSKKPAAAEAAGDWFMQTEEGEQYGPVTKADLDAWVTEGRLDAGCQVLRDGWDQWKWAEEVYPQLSSTPAAPPAAEQIEVAPITATMPAPVLPQVTVTPAVQTPAPVIAAEEPAAGEAGASPVRRYLADIFSPLLLFVVIMGFACPGVSCYFAVRFVVMLLTLMSMASKLGGGLPWQIYVMLLQGLASIGAMVLYMVASYFLNGFRQGLDQYLRRNSLRDMQRAMIPYKKFWQFTFIATAIMGGVMLLSIITMESIIGALAGGSKGGPF